MKLHPIHEISFEDAKLRVKDFDPSQFVDFIALSGKLNFENVMKMYDMIKDNLVSVEGFTDDDGKNLSIEEFKKVIPSSVVYYQLAHALLNKIKDSVSAPLIQNAVESEKKSE